MPSFALRAVETSDISFLAELYVEIYHETNSLEKWTIESASDFITYFYKQCPGLFFVAESDATLVGGIWGQVKPWWSGNKIYNLETFVKKDYRKHGLSKMLFRKLFEESIRLHNAKTVEAVTFNDQKFPLSYYEKIALTRDKQLILLEGNVAEILKSLN